MPPRDGLPNFRSRLTEKVTESALGSRALLLLLGGGGDLLLLLDRGGGGDRGGRRVLVRVLDLVLELLDRSEGELGLERDGDDVLVCSEGVRSGLG